MCISGMLITTFRNWTFWKEEKNGSAEVDTVMHVGGHEGQERRLVLSMDEAERRAVSQRGNQFDESGRLFLSISPCRHSFSQSPSPSTNRSIQETITHMIDISQVYE